MKRIRKAAALFCAAVMALTAIPAGAAEIEDDAASTEYAEEEPKMTAFEQKLSDYFFNGGEAPKKSKLEKITSLEVYGTVVLVNRTPEDFFGIEEGAGVVYAMCRDYGDEILESYLCALRHRHYENDESRYYYPIPKNAIKTDLIAKMTNLKNLRIHDAKLKKITFVRDLTKLRELLLSGSFKDISAVKGLKKLTYLYLNGSFRDISAVKKLKKLTTLELYGTYRDISFVKGLKKLTTLVLSGSFRDVSMLENLNALTSLRLSSNEEITGIEVLQWRLPKAKIWTF